MNLASTKNAKHKCLVSHWSLHTRRSVRTAMISARQLVVSYGSPRQACVYQKDVRVCVCVEHGRALVGAANIHLHVHAPGW